jgi:SAM-dependent methyltransferase
MTSALLETSDDRKTSVLRGLHCPYCGADFGNTALGAYDILRCHCSEYPVIDRIPIVQHVDGLSSVVDAVKAGNTRAALLKALNVFRVRWARRSRWHQLQYHLACRWLTSATPTAFEDAVQRVRKPKIFADYLIHRYANLSFVSDMAFMPLIGAFAARRVRDRPVRILDLACGAGHSSFLLSTWFPDASTVSVDQDFVSLCLAKRFLAPRATFVCMDVEMPSVFADDQFGVIHCLDAFHYFRSKRAIVSELCRVAEKDALWVFPHLHNALRRNMTPGIPLAPEQYAACFEQVAPLLFDEAQVLPPAPGDPIRRPEPDSFGKLSNAQSVALIGGGRDVLGCDEPLTAWLSERRSSLRLNPIFRGDWSRGTLRVQRAWPNEVLREECAALDAFLPQRLDIEGGDLVRFLSDDAECDGGLVRTLINRFVLVPLPPGYLRQDLTHPSSARR